MWPESTLHSMRMEAVFLTQLSTRLVLFGTSSQPAYAVVVLGLLGQSRVAAGFLLVMTDLVQACGIRPRNIKVEEGELESAHCNRRSAQSPATIGICRRFALRSHG